MRAISDSYAFLRQTSEAQVERTVLAKGHQYLKVSSQGRAALLVLGNVERDPQGDIEVWYSGAREVLRIQNGRLLGATGLSTEWMNVRLASPPDWLSVAGPTSYARRRDMMPGYDFDESDKVTVQPIGMPSDTRYTGPGAARLRWYVEHSQGRIALRDARYAVTQKDGRAVVVYGEQCLDRGLCISWQRWPAEA
ncbi:YjbF family lipoprotein [Paraburkholderia phenoliruptrix]|uniref:Group 4 capsule polysaccharide lipoprotein gfcB, YjbF n=2 Tax=Paraburkholderia phenoliruptrix TaxID=252970 RepID=K0DV50_9BURK|nr:YjbF family lipoprotein [Paraburkholderia phenoliruptrix]AFT90116.1 hypothetical protein BUPH_04585 [Paraburkholderia phenoliruptrix BR3459a]CAB4052752.1 hypothetical protein LMG9964_06442 [Paraburkholderia phenoliruptrix]